MRSNQTIWNSASSIHSCLVAKQTPKKTQIRTFAWNFINHFSIQCRLNSLNVVNMNKILGLTAGSSCSFTPGRTFFSPGRNMGTAGWNNHGRWSVLQTSQDFTLHLDTNLHALLRDVLESSPFHLVSSLIIINPKNYTPIINFTEVICIWK